MPTVYEKLVLTDHRNLPRSVRDALIAKPAAQLSVRAANGAFELLSPELPWDTAPVALIPKLGVKTWRESGHLQILNKGFPVLDKLEAILREPTRQQRLAMQAFEETHAPPVLYLTPYVDFTHVSEARMLGSRGAVQFTSACLRGNSAPLYEAARPVIRDFAENIAHAIELESCIIDVALAPDGRVLLVEVNPALEPAEVKILSQRLDAQDAA